MLLKKAIYTVKSNATGREVEITLTRGTAENTNQAWVWVDARRFDVPNVSDLDDCCDSAVEILLYVHGVRKPDDGMPNVTNSEITDFANLLNTLSNE